MSFKSFFYVSESFDYTPEDIKKSERNKGHETDIEYGFYIDGYEYSVLVTIDNATKIASFIFAIIGDEFENPLSIVGVGSSHKVFGAVANIFKRFTEEYRGEYKHIKFSAAKKDTSRVRLYDRFMKNSFVVDNFDVDIDERDMIKFYLLTPKSNDDTKNLQEPRNMDVR